MSISVTDYLLDQSTVEWSKALETWSWLLPPEVTLWLANRFADLFIVVADGSIHMLDVGRGSLEKVAASRDEFCELIDDQETANDWLMISLVDEMVAAGVDLRSGQCYGFKYPVVIGGEYAVGNIATIPVEDYLGSLGSIHEQLRDVPDGTQVRLVVVD